MGFQNPFVFNVLKLSKPTCQFFFYLLLLRTVINAGLPYRFIAAEWPTENSAHQPQAPGSRVLIRCNTPLKQQREASISSSYDEERAAMRMALEWPLPSYTAIAICTGSQSLLKTIQSGSGDTTDLRRMLNKRAGKITLDPTLDLRPPRDCWQ